MATTRKTSKTMGARKMAAAGERGGFTIIEVVLVLAIAGLIFLMVFIALPALQRSQRDTQRRENMSALQTAVTNYQGNNNGKLPADGEIAATSEDATGANAPTIGSNGTTYLGKNITNDTAVKLIITYLNSVDATVNKFTDPTGYAYGIKICTLGGSGTTDTCSTGLGSGTFAGGAPNKAAYDAHLAFVVKHARCDGDHSVFSPNARDYTVMLKFEGSGVYCQSNN